MSINLQRALLDKCDECGEQMSPEEYEEKAGLCDQCAERVN